jgi:hypothetical protein
MWLQKFFFRIAKRHLFTTQITRIRDFLKRGKMPFSPLRVRWGAKVD